MYKSFIKRLPGPQSYCKCTNLCSPLEVDHVIPKAFIRKSGFPNKVSNDLHNLYPCCSKINLDKTDKIFGQDFLFSTDQTIHTGAVARACLYMYDTYQLPIKSTTVSLWRQLDKIHEPKEFEISRNNLIFDVTKRKNHYLQREAEQEYIIEIIKDDGYDKY
ncbi:MAG: endonuclease I [Barrevirus sp.]|uniref:Endonuclease I n=1 Tax=Barrevirus sp. TaxID=2487763 RepID=A0A3G4ZPM7_9VIRU|nr:MAG: endonuclease I [Barrevirus sp.]